MLLEVISWSLTPETNKVLGLGELYLKTPYDLYVQIAFRTWVPRKGDPEGKIQVIDIKSQN